MIKWYLLTDKEIPKEILFILESYNCVTYEYTIYYYQYQKYHNKRIFTEYDFLKWSKHNFRYSSEEISEATVLKMKLLYD